METIGQKLKSRRVDRGLNLAEVHDSTKITMQSLAALEEDRFDAFPNKVYSRAFLRDYANYLGLDSSSLLDQYEVEWNDGMPVKEQKQAKAKKPAPAPAPTEANTSTKTRGSKAWAYILGFVLILGAAGSGYYYYQTHQAKPAASKVPVPAPKNPTPVPSVNPTPKPTTPVVPNAGTNPVANAVPVKPTAPAIPADQIKVEIRAAERPVWIRVNIDGEKPLLRTLAAGESAAFVGKRVSVFAGDASALTVKLNDKSIGHFAEPKTWKVTRVFTPESANKQ